MEQLTGRTKQAVIRALRDIARDKRATPKLRWEAATKLLELEGGGISNIAHAPSRQSKAMASKLKTLAREIVTGNATPGITRAAGSDGQTESENVAA